MKYSVTTYSFARSIANGEMTIADCVKKAADIGFDGIELSPSGYIDDKEILGFAEEFGKRARSFGLEVANLAIAADFNKDEKGRHDEVERLKRYVDAAALMGSKLMRHDVFGAGGFFNSFAQGLETVADCVRGVAEYAQGSGVRTMTENHGFICQDSDRIEALFNAVGYENFGLLVDIGNFLCVDEEPSKAVSRLAPHAFYVHAKDFLYKSGSGEDPGACFFKTRGQNYLRGTVLGHGCVPVKQCINILKAAGYDGYISLEFEGMEPVDESIRVGLENLKRFSM